MKKLKTPLHWMRGVLLALLALLVLAGMPQQVLAQMTVTYFHNEISGSAVAASDSAGRVVWKENYRPYGERQVKAAGSESNGVWFAGKPQEVRSGLVYMGARYYDPVAGRFMGVDPVGWQEDNLHSFNRYAYANNNPYRYVDPDGQYADLAIEAVSLTVGFHSLIGNWRQSNWSGAAVDAGGIVVDVVGAAIPGIPGMAGLGIKASREAAEVVAKGVAGETRFINGVKVTDRATGNVLQGTVDLKPTLDRIAAGKSFPHRNDGAVFGNKEGLLPQQPAGYYREYVHPTPGVNGPGPQRIVTGQGGEVFYTPNHYGTFIPVRP